MQLLAADGSVLHESQLVEANLDPEVDVSEMLPPFSAYSAAGEVEVRGHPIFYRMFQFFTNCVYMIVRTLSTYTHRPIYYDYTVPKMSMAGILHNRREKLGSLPNNLFFRAITKVYRRKTKFLVRETKFLKTLLQVQALY